MLLLPPPLLLRLLSPPSGRLYLETRARASLPRPLFLSALSVRITLVGVS